MYIILKIHFLPHKQQIFCLASKLNIKRLTLWRRNYYYYFFFNFSTSYM